MIYPDFPRVKVNFLLDQGGAGDNIARLPVIKFIKDTHKHVQEIVWVADYFYPLAKLALPNVNFKKFSENDRYDDKHPGRCTSAGWFTNLKMHMTDHAFALLANQIPEDKYKNYIKLDLKSIGVKRFNLPERKRYVIMTTGFTSPVREFLPQYINEVNDYIISKGYEVVFLGKRQTYGGYENTDIQAEFKDEIDFSKGLNLVDQTSLLEAAKIIEGAKTIVGVDNGILHLAGMTDIPIVGAFSTLDPLHRMPYRQNVLGHNYYPVVPPLDEPERFFQSRVDFCFEHDFRYSYYGNDSLIRSLKPELYIEQLEKIL